MWLWDVFCSYFWSVDFWFPHGVTWDDLKNKDGGIYHPQRTDLLLIFPIAALLFVLRKIFERYIATPIAFWCGLKETVHRKVRPNDTLENAYTTSRFLKHEVTLALSKKTSMTTRQVERWFRIRRNQDKPTALSKFTEGCWRFTFYLIIFYVGLYVLWDKPWFSNVSLSWHGFPHQHVSNDIIWYYMTEMGFYVSLMFSQFFDVKRKDFWEMFIHHVATLTLMFLSWCNNFVRIGTLVLVLHDACDHSLELSKLLNYLKMSRACNTVFAFFTFLWLVTRLIIYPIKIVYSTLFEAIPIVGYARIYYTYNICLILLQVLHVVWFIFIGKVAYRALFLGEETKDARSESEEDVSEEDVNTPVANGLKQTAS